MDSNQSGFPESFVRCMHEKSCAFIVESASKVRDTNWQREPVDNPLVIEPHQYNNLCATINPYATSKETGTRSNIYFDSTLWLALTSGAIRKPGSSFPD